MPFWAQDNDSANYLGELLNIKLMVTIHGPTSTPSGWCCKCICLKSPRFVKATLPPIFRVFCNNCAGFGPDGIMLSSAELNSKQLRIFGTFNATYEDIVLPERHPKLASVCIAGSRSPTTYVNLSIPPPLPRALCCSYLVSSGRFEI